MQIDLLPAFAARTNGGRNVPDRLNRADFVIGVHHRDQDGVIPDRASNRISVHYTVHSNANPRHVDAFVLEFAARLENSRMLNRSCHNVDWPAAKPPYDTENREVIRFGPAAGKDQFARSDTERNCKNTPGLLQLPPRALPHAVDTRCVTRHVAQSFPYELRHLGQYERSGIVIEVKQGSKRKENG